tara:strand:- start:3532 stop:4167 length:636 start_codon:yes stop_codon:yes gene_type:complete
MEVKNFFFNFDKIQREEFKKKQSLSILPADLFNYFISSYLKEYDEKEIKDIENFFSKLAVLNFDKIYKNYLSHPIRLAQMWICINKKVPVSEIKFALAHNIIENGYFEKIKNNLEDTEIEKIKILTIDRNKEKNLSYLNNYYMNIEKHSENLIIFKSLDKLDNLLIGEKYLFDEYSINLLKNEVCNRLKKYNTKLNNYIINIINLYEKKYS